jgi:hypothetical protein
MESNVKLEVSKTGILFGFALRTESDASSMGIGDIQRMVGWLVAL